MNFRNLFLCFLLYSLALCLFISCNRLIEDEFIQHPAAPVLNGILQADSTIRVHLSLTGNLKDSVMHIPEKALVYIASSDGWTDTLSATDHGWYVSKHQAKAGITYSCIAKVKGFDALTATTTVPLPSTIDHFELKRVVGKDMDGIDISACLFDISNSLSQKCYWEVRMYEVNVVLDSLFQPAGTELYQSNAVYMEAGSDLVLQYEALPLTVFSNVYMHDTAYKVRLYVPAYEYANLSNTGPDYKSNSLYYIELRSVDESYYRYQKQLYLYQTSGGNGNFGGAVQAYSLYSNVKNGRGIFTSYAITRQSVNFKISGLQ